MAEWYALQTYAGGEQGVKKAINSMITELSLSDRILSVLVPTEDVVEVKNSKKKIVERSIYSGYCFLEIENLDLDLTHMLQSLGKVSGFIGEGKRPTPLSKKDIDLIVEKDKNRKPPRPKISFDIGEVVRIIDGSFANFTGSVSEYDHENGTLTVTVSIFGRSTPVDISYTQVEKII